MHAPHIKRSIHESSACCGWFDRGCLRLQLLPHLIDRLNDPTHNTRSLAYSRVSWSKGHQSEQHTLGRTAGAGGAAVSSARRACRMIYNFYIFDRKGACLFYREWSRPLNTLAGDPQEERKLMFGMLYSIKGLVAALGSKNAPSSEGLNHLRTNAYTLHHYETPTGLRFVLNTDNAMAGEMRAHLRHIYAGIWVEHVVKHPQYRIGHGNQPLPPLFADKLEDYVTGLPGFR